ncbi:MAG TPA: DNA-3-methyladenine glycosylase [Thermomicrobiales bacterium]|nr:DNA-3-methyladenine glycosylase [Thermomicrobiales bacterium]
MPVDRAWFSRHPVKVAWDLIGCVLRIERDGVVVSGRIVETEAYAGPDDPASHASRSPVGREVMMGRPGTVYTYLSYGIHTMMNIVAHEERQGGAVLLRALEPLEGIEVMGERRNGVSETQLAKGPGSLGQAMDIRLSDLGVDLIDAPEWTLLHGDVRHPVHAGPRVGISKAVVAPWRFFERPNPHVSRHRKGEPVERHELPSLIPPSGTPLE